jgi:hypothetical protein
LRSGLEKNFIITGGKIVNKFLVSTGCLPGAHDPECPVYWQIAHLMPPWTNGLRKAAHVPGLDDDHPHG